MKLDDAEIRHLAADLGSISRTANQRSIKVVRFAAAQIAARAKRIAPVDTGQMRDSIGVDTVASADAFTAIIGPTTHYAPWVEHGVGRRAPKPFMGPAADAVEPGFNAAMATLAEELLL